MSYVDEVIELVIAKNPAQPEFHQAVKGVLDFEKSMIYYLKLFPEYADSKKK